jgi:hypothetical protein
VAADLKGALTAPKVKHHAAILDAKGVGPLMRAMDVYDGQKLTKLALKLIAHALPRSGELRLASVGGAWMASSSSTATTRSHP